MELVKYILIGITVSLIIVFGAAIVIVWGIIPLFTLMLTLVSPIIGVLLITAILLGMMIGIATYCDPDFRERMK